MMEQPPQRWQLAKAIVPEPIWLKLRFVRARMVKAWFALVGRSRSPQKDVRGFTLGEAVPGTIAVYFGDGKSLMFELNQWFGVLNQLHPVHPVMIVTRSISVYEHVLEVTDLPVVCAPFFDNLITLYDASDFKTIVYVNNSRSNFQSLTYRSAMHVYINHGESDKRSASSNRSKAYDRAFVAGRAACMRMLAEVLDFDPDKLVCVGRPMLDVDYPPALPPSPRRTVIYAPTHEGDDMHNRHSSVDVFGVRIIEQLLELPDVRVVYRPHPRVLTTRTPDMVTGHTEILERMEHAIRDDPEAGHLYDPTSNILAMFDGVDLLLTDMSSVAIDFLYLRTDAPIVMTDRDNDAIAMQRGSALAASVPIVNNSNMAELGRLVLDELANDSRLADRTWARDFYFDGLTRGQSMPRLFEELDRLMKDREELIAARQKHVDAYLNHLASRVRDPGPPTEQSRSTA